MTVNAIINAAYLKCGIRSPDGIKDTEALEALNNMLSSWSADMAIPAHIRGEETLVIGQAEYTIGSGGDFDIVRPLSISNMYLTDSDNYSYQLEQVSSKDYGRIGQKTLEGRPENFHYYPSYSLGKIFFNKEADKAYTLCYEVLQYITEFAALDETVSLPNEYKEALVYNLAIRLAENNSIELTPSVIALAQNAYFSLLRSAATNRMPPMARFDFGSGALSNIETGE
jgi:hypothetical protein